MIIDVDIRKFVFAEVIKSLTEFLRKIIVPVVAVGWLLFFFFFQAEEGIRDLTVTGVQTCALPICVLCPLTAMATCAGAPVSTVWVTAARRVSWNVYWPAKPLSRSALAQLRRKFVVRNTSSSPGDRSRHRLSTISRAMPASARICGLRAFVDRLGHEITHCCAS